MGGRWRNWIPPGGILPYMEHLYEVCAWLLHVGNQQCLSVSHWFSKVCFFSDNPGGGWSGCESDGFWSSQKHLLCYSCSEAEVVAVFLLPLWEQTCTAIIFQDAPGASSAGPAGCGFSAQAVPRKAATKEWVQQQWTIPTEVWIHLTHLGVPSGPKFCEAGSCMSPMARELFGPGLIFCKVIFLSCPEWRLVKLFPAHCTWSLGHLQQSAASCPLLTRASLRPPLARGHGDSWCTAHGPCGGFCRELTPLSSRGGSSWRKKTFEFLPFSISLKA